MKDHTRREIAYIAARLISGGDSSALYDYSSSKHFGLSGDVSPANVSPFMFMSTDVTLVALEILVLIQYFIPGTASI